jgi:endonuclease III related protein
MPSLADSYEAMLESLEALGPPFPPVSTNEPGIVFAVLTGSLLSRMFAPRQARTAWEAFHAAGFDSPVVVARANVTQLVEATQKLDAPLKPLSAKTLMPLHLLAKWIVDRGGLAALDDIPTEELRDDLLLIPGISPAMTDALLLYGLKRPVYPADRPTYRILARHGWIEPTTDYEETRATIEEPAHGDVVVLSNLAAWFDRTGELYCRARGAMCEGCPLQPFLPENGPHEAGAE